MARQSREHTAARGDGSWTGRRTAASTLAGELMSGVSCDRSEMTEMSCACHVESVSSSRHHERPRTRGEGRWSASRGVSRLHAALGPDARRQRHRDENAQSTRPCARATSARSRPRTRTGPRPAHARSRCTARRSCRLRGHAARGCSLVSGDLLLAAAEVRVVGQGGALLGCHISVRNFILGGRSGKSGGKVSVARRKPPSYSVSGGLSHE